MATVNLPTTIIIKITSRLTGLKNQLSATPPNGHFSEPNDQALRWYRALLQARINELAWLLKILGVSILSPTKTLH